MKEEDPGRIRKGEANQKKAAERVYLLTGAKDGVRGRRKAEEGKEADQRGFIAEEW